MKLQTAMAFGTNLLLQKWNNAGLNFLIVSFNLNCWNFQNVLNQISHMKNQCWYCSLMAATLHLEHVPTSEEKMHGTLSLRKCLCWKTHCSNKLTYNSETRTLWSCIVCPSSLENCELFGIFNWQNHSLCGLGKCQSIKAKREPWIWNLCC